MSDILCFEVGCSDIEGVEPPILGRLLGVVPCLQSILQFQLESQKTRSHKKIKFRGG